MPAIWLQPIEWHSSGQGKSPSSHGEMGYHLYQNIGGLGSIPYYTDQGLKMNIMQLETSGSKHCCIMAIVYG